MIAPSVVVGWAAGVVAPWCPVSTFADDRGGEASASRGGRLADEVVARVGAAPTEDGAGAAAAAAALDTEPGDREGAGASSDRDDAATDDGGVPGGSAGADDPGPWVLGESELETLRARALRQGLVDLKRHVPDVVLDLRYATEENVAGRRLYPENFPCFVARDTATKVAAAAEYLRKRDRRLVVWDAFRPGEVQVALWRAAPRQAYVADPRKRLSNHCRGAALDVTLADAGGRPLKMPSAFDDFSERAASRYSGDDPAIRGNLALLREAMLVAGFVYIESEWWHYHDPDATDRSALYAVRDLGLAWPEAAGAEPVSGSADGEEDPGGGDAR